MLVQAGMLNKVIERLPQPGEYVLGYHAYAKFWQIYRFVIDETYPAPGHFVSGNCCFCEDIEYWLPLCNESAEIINAALDRPKLAALTIGEQEVMTALASAWNRFLKLPVLHESDNEEFMRAVHAAENIILARPALRFVDKKNE